MRWRLEPQLAGASDIAAAPSGGMWIARDDKVLLLRQGRLTATKGKIGTGVRGLAVDGQTLWVSSRSGFLRFAHGRWERVTPAPTLRLGKSPQGYEQPDYWYSAFTVRGGDVFAVGGFIGAYNPAKLDDQGWLTAVYHAGRWSTSRNHDSMSTSLVAVSGSARDDVWAVGRYGETSAAYQEVMVHWNGTRWTDVSKWHDGIVSLADVLALARNDVWAVGTTRTGEGGPVPTGFAIEHWNGQRWTIAAAPDTHWRADQALNTLAAFSANDVWAGGDVDGHPVLLHWNGTRWQLAPSPPFGTTIAKLAAGANGSLWAISRRGTVAQAVCHDH